MSADGANVDTENDEGITSFQVVAARKYSDSWIIQVLAEYDAK